MLIEKLKLSKTLITKCHDAGFETVMDLLRHYPIRYEAIEIKPFSEWAIGDKVWLEGEIIEPISHFRMAKNRQLTRFHLQSPLGLFKVSIFNRPWLKARQHITLQAKYEGPMRLTALNYNQIPLDSQLGLKPVYALSKSLTQKDMVRLLEKALERIDEIAIQDLPVSLKQQYRLISVKQALKVIHQPESSAMIHQAERCLKYEEFLRFQTKLRISRAENTAVLTGRRRVFDRRIVLEQLNHLPFRLTDDQMKALNEILDDMQSNYRMNRLLQGDVGSGKTVIAALAMYAAVCAGYQAALLVPTEILARQHLVSIRKYLPENVRIEVYHAGLSSKDKKVILENLSSGTIDLLIGTHALLYDKVAFRRCGLAVVDEQHRFGVNQRRLMSEKGEQLDFLVMSATPIPRTLAAALFHDMDISSIQTYHAGKSSVKTVLNHKNSVQNILDVLLRRIQENDQIYVVCPSIEESDKLELKSAEKIYDGLRSVMPASVRMGLLHSRIDHEQKEILLNDFYQARIDCLVCTTVIEVGVNVPTANTMVIYNAERFGLSQLHQLRGRVGRASKEGLCYLLSDTEDPLSLERLNVIVNSTDGFEIARQDLKLRGPGEIFGLRQSGLPSFLIANVISDQAILNVAMEDSLKIMEKPDQFKDWIENCRLEIEHQRID